MLSAITNRDIGTDLNMWGLLEDKELFTNDNNSIASSNTTWLESLENVISSSSSSTSTSNSPLDEQLLNSTDVFSTNLNMPNTMPQQYTLSNAPVIKQEQAEDIKINNKIPQSQTTKIKKKRAPRKRLTADQKQAHNKIEKRYRININTKIAKLQQIIPWVACEETAFEVSDTLKNIKSGDNSVVDLHKNSLISVPPPPATIVAQPSAKLNKSMILEKAVDYILYLQNNEKLYEMEVQRLRNELYTAKHIKTTE
ncbi:hypothetical protein Kpol_1065p8 [Vanderwaltozyma polyspora DSM 70294]|uniref:BHLH domain-containing protein n=1 Tax=Vanderwaltozyma polyspora (strain ATCC 22028 / DSM 70294 / BCRC 21397 / CBS 2163 / NBRC 10782 / NRRL Y-8283 / UCD 57-17) TaxID=436907 RepID=A7TL31_VANPO|nr:uncharacterized protein Kpol_1065p8 [Vanderwaltozyma polyspora DSM 70294]EDO16994.1 hypothetical protein Kpol_1065p8 [Vanderwaltozyma polyspora DSM 70294]